MRGRPFLDLTGVRTGMLTAVSVAPGADRFRRKRWLCRCDCGAEKIIASRHIKNNAVKSCGCYARITAAANGRVGGVKISGTKSPLFNHNLTEEHRIKSRNLVALRMWKRAVLKRDGYKCDYCGTQEHLAAHHLNSWVTDVAGRFNINNGMTLCSEHHKMFHASIGGTRHPCAAWEYYDFKASKNER